MYTHTNTHTHRTNWTKMFAFQSLSLSLTHWFNIWWIQSHTLTSCEPIIMMMMINFINQNLSSPFCPSTIDISVFIFHFILLNLNSFSFSYIFPYLEMWHTHTHTHTHNIPTSNTSQMFFFTDLCYCQFNFFSHSLSLSLLINFISHYYSNLLIN